MMLHRIKSEGLAHLSYLVGSEGEAAVIDPRLDSEIYEEMARAEGMRVSLIFETHRNEDYVVGSRDLASRTGATILHGGRLDFAYGEPVGDGDRFDLGGIRLAVLETPGHTPESISIALYDITFSDSRPIAVFTGDTLFVGDTGRTDFLPGQEREMAGLLYESVFGRILPLGDSVILLPGHGEGSLCGGSLASREISSLGYERLHNPALRHASREDFIAAKLAERHPLPPYFSTVHRLNLVGPPILSELPRPVALTPGELASMREEAQVLDVRLPEAFAGAHVPGSLEIPLEMIPETAGWLLPQGRPLLLVAESEDRALAAVRLLSRMGFLDVRGFLKGGMSAWYTAGMGYGHVEVVHVEELVDWIASGEDFVLLDVRTPREYASGHLPGAINIFLGELPMRLDEIPRGRRVVTFCGSGLRAISAASVLKAHGFADIFNCFGSMRACAALGCPMEGS